MAKEKAVKRSSRTRQRAPLRTKKKPLEVNPEQFSKIQAIVARQLKKSPDEILARSQLQNDLGADSLDAMEIIFQLEEDFDIKIAEEDAGKMVSVQDIAVYVARRTK